MIQDILTAIFIGTFGQTHVPKFKEWDVPSLPLEDLVSYTDLDPAVAKGQSFMDSGEAASANLLEAGYEMIRVAFETS